VRRADCLGSRAGPHTVAVPAALRARLRPFHTSRKASRVLEQSAELTWESADGLPHTSGQLAVQNGDHKGDKDAGY
jgi:hypothetical protein